MWTQSCTALATFTPFLSWTTLCRQLITGVSLLAWERCHACLLSAAVGLHKQSKAYKATATVEYCTFPHAVHQWQSEGLYGTDAEVSKLAHMFGALSSARPAVDLLHSVALL